MVALDGLRPDMVHAVNTPHLAALTARGAEVFVHDPLYSNDELAHFGWEPYAYGEPVDAAVVQADHAEYRDLAPASLPGIRTFVDGRRVSTADAWPGVTYRVIGIPGA